MIFPVIHKSLCFHCKKIIWLRHEHCSVNLHCEIIFLALSLPRMQRRNLISFWEGLSSPPHIGLSSSPMMAETLNVGKKRKV